MGYKNTGLREQQIEGPGGKRKKTTGLLVGREWRVRVWRVGMELLNLLDPPVSGRRRYEAWRSLPKPTLVLHYFPFSLYPR